MHEKAHLFSSIMLINNNGKLTVKRLPVEAQFSAVTSIVVKDFDHDGNKDIVLGGNKFDVEVETTAADASPGLFMKGMGDLTFRCTKPSESGFFVPYNVKDIRPVKFGNDVALVVAINNDALRIFRNSKGKKAILAVLK